MHVCVISSPFTDPWVPHLGSKPPAPHRERHARVMLDALKEQPVWVVPAVIGMAVTLKELSERADEEQSRKGLVANQVSCVRDRPETDGRDAGVSILGAL